MNKILISNIFSIFYFILYWLTYAFASHILNRTNDFIECIHFDQNQAKVWKFHNKYEKSGIYSLVDKCNEKLKSENEIKFLTAGSTLSWTREQNQQHNCICMQSKYICYAGAGYICSSVPIENWASFVDTAIGCTYMYTVRITFWTFFFLILLLFLFSRWRRNRASNSALI